jgi:hypothetical protein
MGFDRSPSPEPTLPNIDLTGYEPPRLGTPASNRSFDQRPPMNSLRSPDMLPTMPERVRSPVSGPNGVGGLSGYSMNRPGPQSRPPIFNDGRSSPAPSGYQRRGANGPGYPPPRSATALPARTPQQRFQPQRNMTAPQPFRERDVYDRGNGGMSSNQRGYGNGNNYDTSRY